MPFGSESAWDSDEEYESHSRNGGSPMPFGSESAWDDGTVAIHHTDMEQVTNAFRQ